MTMAFCAVLGIVMLAMGAVGSLTGAHSHAILGFGMNIYHNLFHLSLGFISLAAVAAGPRHARIFCFEMAGFSALLALAGAVRLPLVIEILNLTLADAWLYAGLGLFALVVALGSPVPLRLADAVDSARVDRPPYTWA